MVTLFIGQQALTGGTNGITNFTTLNGFDLSDEGVQKTLYVITVICLAGAYLLCRAIVNSRYGHLLIALREDENRARFIGYNPVPLKITVFALSAGLAGLAGALFVPQVGLISPSEMGIVPSIEMVIWVAVGGRATLIGAVIGAVLVNWGKTTFSEGFPEIWQYFYGGLFIAVVLFFPTGLVGTFKDWWRFLRMKLDRSYRLSLNPVEADTTKRLELSLKRWRKLANRSLYYLGRGLMTQNILELQDVTISFDGFKVLNNLNFWVEEGELRFLIGPNGAGKTTLLDVITAKTRPQSGKITFNGTTDILKQTDYKLVRLGIGRKFQTPSVFESLSVYENLQAALGFNDRLFRLLTSLKADQKAKIEQVLGRIGLQAKANRLAGILSHGEKQWLEIGMLVVQNPKLLLLDEPIAGMSRAERDKTGELIQDLKKDHSILVIEHDMQFVRQFATQVTVLHQGQVLREGAVEEIQNDPKVIEVYLGRKRDKAA